MRGPFIFSILFHIAIVVAALIDWPDSSRELVELGGQQSFEVVSEEELAQLQTPAETPKPEEKPEEPKPEEPKPDPAPAPPPPPPEPTPPPPEPKPPEPKPEPPKAATAPPVFQPPKKPKEPKKPEEPKKDFASSVLNTLADVKDAPPPPPKPEEKKEVTTLNEAVAAALGQRPQPSAQASSRLSSQGMTDSELAIVRDQIVRCWNPPVGAANVKDMLAVVEIEMNQNKSVNSARVTELSSSATQQYGESVLRAVQLCSPLKLPDGKYAEWNKIILTFSPRDMVF
jgi:outer membrane biosynthesis protein TonB